MKTENNEAKTGYFAYLDYFLHKYWSLILFFTLILFIYQLTYAEDSDYIVSYVNELGEIIEYNIEFYVILFLFLYSWIANLFAFSITGYLINKKHSGYFLVFPIIYIIIYYTMIISEYFAYLPLFIFLILILFEKVHIFSSPEILNYKVQKSPKK